ncbi:MAG: DUF1338 family protein [Planctomycetota bacterium]
MNDTNSSPLIRLLEDQVGPKRWNILDRVQLIPEVLSTPPAGGSPQELSRAQVAMALATGFLIDLCERVPLAAAYLLECDLRKRKFVFDHGAMRTVAMDSGALPAGRRAVERILLPMGYQQTEVYPLDRLGMNGYVYTHLDFPESIPQYFVSELEPEHFSPAFQRGVADLVRTSVDPIGPRSRASLQALEERGSIGLEEARVLLPKLQRAFSRHHREPTTEEYELFLQESAEMAWISTEGHTFNHITDRVADVVAVAEGERRRGRPIKDTVEVSGSGRVRQTAMRAGMVERLFRCAEGITIRTVPGSFIEFISRDRLPDGRLDLAFDASNAQGIFKMTDSRKSSES